MGSQLTREADGTLYTRSGREIGVAATKTFTSQCLAFTLFALHLAELRETLPPERIAELRAGIDTLPELAAAYLAEDCARLGADRAHRRRGLGEGVLPLHRPPPRHAGVPRGRAQAQGDQLHPDRLLRRRRDEARADRPALRGHAGRRGDERLARLREGRLERAGGARARRPRDRRDHRGQRGRVAPRRLDAADPAHRARARADPGVDAAADPGLPHRRRRGLPIDQPRNLAKTVTVE